MFIDEFLRLCAEKGVSPSRAGVDIGVSRSTVSDWIQKGAMPRTIQLYKLAAYFGVTVDALLGNKTGPEPTPDEDGAEKEILDIYNDLPDDKKAQADAFIRFLGGADK